MLYFLEIASMLIATSSSSSSDQYTHVSLRSKSQALRYNLNVAASHLHMLASNQHTPKCLVVIMK